MESTSPVASPALPSSALRPRTEPSASAPSALLRLARRLPPLMLVWAVPGLIAASQNYIYAQTKDPTYPFSRALMMQLPPWQYWALATPLVLALGRRWRLERGVWPRSLAVHLPAFAALMLPHVLLVYFVSRAAREPWYLENSLGQLLPMMLSKFVVTDLLIYGSILSVGYAFEYHRRYREGELAQSQLETRLVHAQLDALRAQLHPHFLFNTLNAISVLVRKQDTAGSIRMLTGVSELLRMALNNTGRQQVPLHEDLDFLERYLDIEQTRFPDRLAGGGGYDHTRNLTIGRSPEVDALLFDTNGPENSAALYDNFVAGGVTGKPIVNVELFGAWSRTSVRGVFADSMKAEYLAEIQRAASRPGLSVFFHSNSWCQELPNRDDLAGYGTTADPGMRWYFEGVANARGLTP